MINWSAILGPRPFRDHQIAATRDNGDLIGIIIHHHGSWDLTGFDNRLDYALHGPIAPYYHLWHNTGQNVGQGEGYVNAITQMKANHAGVTDSAHLDRIAAGVRVDARPDLPRKFDDATNEFKVLNDRFYGLCLEGPPHTDEQIASCVQSAAQICTYENFDPFVAIMGHKESAAPRGRKSDPQFDMNWFRTEVQEAMVAFTADEEARIRAVLPLIEDYIKGLNSYNATQPKEDQTSMKGQGRWATPVIRQHTRKHGTGFDHVHIEDRIEEHAADHDAHEDHIH